MYFVGFPEGLGRTKDKMKRWIEWAIAKPHRCHYSIYEDHLGYCGETFYNVDINVGTTAGSDVEIIVGLIGHQYQQLNHHQAWVNWIIFFRKHGLKIRD